MAACERCWADAYKMSLIDGKSQGEHYLGLLQSRQSNPCTPKEQAGQFWDEEKQCDKRLEGKTNAVNC